MPDVFTFWNVREFVVERLYIPAALPTFHRKADNRIPPLPLYEVTTVLSGIS
jgi:hypothetical protein